MFLKAIEIRGFKSFADKTELDFKKGVTAVVGPNGSGKSNISDAIKWVLGEQSVKSLRGGKMEDVIFAGTQFRKPVSLAQVILTLDNTDGALPVDYNDVTITRRIYRSGESEYYINNTKCRLKDVQELFMDTGIGKEGYSIIGQGKIEAVLSGKPEERRGLLEEAAGIVKFKARKEEAEKKLQNTDDNLVRISDILTTYEERLEPLRIESEKANKFIELSEELKLKEVNLVINSMDKLKIKIEDIKQKMSYIGSEIEKLNDEKSNEKESFKKYNEQLAELEAFYDSKKKEYYDEKTKQQSIIAENDLTKEKINNLEEMIKKANIEIVELENKLERISVEKTDFESQFSYLKAKMSQNELQINEKEKYIEQFENQLKDDEAALKHYKNEQLEAYNSISEAKNNITVLKKDRENHELTLKQIATASENYLNSIKINENTKVMLNNEVKSVTEKINEFEKKIKINKASINNLSKELFEKEKRAKELNNEINKAEANKNMLVNLEEQYEGYNKAVKNLMSHVQKGFVPNAANKCFVLGEIINVKKELEVALEIALGGAISNIITESELLAKDLIKYLKIKNLGRATFLPLNILKNKELIVSENVKKAEGYIGIASDLIQYDRHFTPAILHILGRTVIAKDMDCALAIAKMSNFSYRIVTLAGDVVNPGGALSGGSIYNKALNIIGRKREIEELKLKLEENSEAFSKINEEIAKKKNDLKVLDDEILNIKDAVHGQNIEITKLMERISSIDLESEKLKKNYKVSAEELAVINNKLTNAAQHLENDENKLKVLYEKEKEIAAKIAEFENKANENSADFQKIKDELTVLKIEKAKADEMYAGKKREADRLDKDLNEASERSGILKNEIKEADRNIFDFKEKIENNYIAVKQIEDGLSDMNKIFEESDVQKISLKEKINMLNDRLEQSSLIITRKEEENHRFEITLAKIETENEAMLQKLNEEYNLTFAEALAYKNEISDINAYKKDIDNIKAGIAKLGSVNVGAVEEYKTVKEKFTFMNGQKEDLVKAKQEIIGVIEEMTSKMKTVFSENFAVIRENFNETFKELFKGGSADLILDGDDVLSAHIEINVQPPGKKLQNINLMSGGEKGLSAIALLFAILKMKPSPFCILDEIEAALDDANVARYAEFLTKFSHNIQFIVITHRKGTMEASDVLYGVTMEEKGVSKIVSVDLTA